VPLPTGNLPDKAERLLANVIEPHMKQRHKYSELVKDVYLNGKANP
jgi:hypothetical protein